MKYKLNYLFPSPVFSVQLEEKDMNIIKNEVQPLIDKFDFIDPWLNGRMKISGGKFGLNILKDLKHFNLMLSKIVGLYLDKLEDKTFKSYNMIESWITKLEKYSYAHIHNHADFDISGVYYLSTSKKDGSIFFSNPVVESPLSKVGTNSILKETKTFEPENGRFIIFPSWLKHGVDTNTSNFERVSLSFNLNIQ